MLRLEYWGRGYATEAAIGWLEEYWKLPRRELDLQDDMPESKELKFEGETVREVLIAEVESENVASIKIMEKCGFRATGVEDEVEDFRGPAVVVHYYLERPGAAKEQP